MRLSMAQMSMVGDMDRNFNKTLQFMDLADEHKADLLFYPEVQLTPFFPQFAKRDVGGALNKVPDEFAISLNDKRIGDMCARCKKYGFYAMPNFYVRNNGKHYNMSLWLTPKGKVKGKAKMVHIANPRGFFEKDYYAPSEEGFCVFDIPEHDAKVGVVNGFDRHMPESIRSCAAMGADLVVIPAGNVSTEPLHMYETELIAQAYQNAVFVAMCNRVGREGDAEFVGGSIVIDPNGKIIVKADASQQFVVCNIEIADAKKAKERRPYLALRRPEIYR
ncbi:MAG: carbon-nitrogen hydrolase family protein [Lachnospiraceae bacterium]|nr:carbon-nitrogen hydrolase family protein [Lachnospiraceae bacterium]